MARNQEKAHLLFNRWTSLKEGWEKGDRPDRRPFLASECKSLPDAEKWRREIVRDISRKVAEIQNAGLGEARLRDLNDEINKLLREKGHWERQIRALGGPDHSAVSAKLFEADGHELPGARGYRYFGAARQLPGVAELFEAAAAAGAEPARRTRGDITRNLTPDYYGFRDEEDGGLLAKEAAREAEWRAAGAAEWDARQEEAAEDEAAAAGGEGAGSAAEIAAITGGYDAAGRAGYIPGGAWGGRVDTSVLVPGVPSQADIDALLVAKRKALLLARYASPELAAEQQAAGAGHA